MGTVHRARFNIPLVIRYLHRRIHSLTEIVINLKFEIVISCLIPRLQKDSISTDFMEVTLFQMQKMEQIVSEKVRRKRPKQMWFLAVIKIDAGAFQCSTQYFRLVCFPSLLCRQFGWILSQVLLRSSGPSGSTFPNAIDSGGKSGSFPLLEYTRPS